MRARPTGVSPRTVAATSQKQHDEENGEHERSDGKRLHPPWSARARVAAARVALVLLRAQGWRIRHVP